MKDKLIRASYRIYFSDSLKVTKLSKKKKISKSAVIRNALRRDYAEIFPNLKTQ